MAAGQNAAYDQFHNQIQLYYYGKGKNVMWCALPAMSFASVA